MEKPVIVCGKSLTQQHFKEGADINKIVARSQRAGMLPPNNKIPQYLDVSSLEDYQTSLNKVITAQNIFDGLPSKIRSRFKNDPSQMIAFLSDPENLDEAVRLGMATIRKLADETEPTQPTKASTKKKTSVQEETSEE